MRVSATYRHFLLFLLSFLGLSLPTHCKCREFRTWSHLMSHTHSLGFPGRGISPTPTSTWQPTTFTRDGHPCLRRDSKPQSQQASGRVPTPLVSRPTGSAVWIHGDIPFSAFTCHYLEFEFNSTWRTSVTVSAVAPNITCQCWLFKFQC